jgi:hypothetical protein
MSPPLCVGRLGDVKVTPRDNLCVRRPNVVERVCGVLALPAVPVESRTWGVEQQADARVCCGTKPESIEHFTSCYTSSRPLGLVNDRLLATNFAYVSSLH